jgi:hypothetical protein|tara:strand:- start:679 stop:846 length:168 start_codon:yes stop_codon:yes gene_type:complete
MFPFIDPFRNRRFNPKNYLVTFGWLSQSKGSFPALEVYTSKKNKTLPALHGLVFV